MASTSSVHYSAPGCMANKTRSRVQRLDVVIALPMIINKTEGPGISLSLSLSVCVCVYYKEPVVVMLLPVILNGRTSNVRGQRTDRVVLVIVRVSGCLFS